MEIWKPVKNYENLYEVSSFGNIRNKKRKTILKPTLSKFNYLFVKLSKDNKTKNFLNHRLVALSFLENINNLPQVNHIDGNKLNNNISNLEWCTASYNIRHAIKLGIMSPSYHTRKDKSSIGKKINRDIANIIREAYNSGSTTLDVLAKKYNITKQTVSLIILNKIWKNE